MDTILFNMHDVILLVTIYQCILFPIFLFTVRSSSLLSNILLASFFLSNAAIPLDILINFGEAFRPWAIDHIPNLFYVFDIGYWVQGPLLLWYIRSLTYRRFRLGWPDVVCIAPYLLFTLHQLVGYHFLPTTTKVEMQTEYSLVSETVSIFFIIFAREALRVFFAVLCVMELKNYRELVTNKYTTNSALNFTWLNLLCYGSLALWSWALLLSLVMIIDKQANLGINFGLMGLMANYVTCGLMGVTMICMAQQSPAFAKLENLQPAKKATQKQPINLDYVHRLENIMQEQKPYLDSNLTLESLASMLSVSPRTLSSVINGHYDCNFFEYINKYRINAAKDKLARETHKNSTVLDIMYEVGFSSKATFNTVFKKTVGMTPREYKKQQLQAVVE